MFYTEVNDSMDIEILVDDFATFYIAGSFNINGFVLLVYVNRSGDHWEPTSVCSSSVTTAS